MHKLSGTNKTQGVENRDYFEWLDLINNVKELRSFLEIAQVVSARFLKLFFAFFFQYHTKAGDY